MKELQFKQDSKTAKWYKFFWNKDDYDMPEDTCTYYRDTILSIPLIPLVFIGLILSAFTKQLNKFWDRAGVTWSIILVPIIFGSGFAEKGVPNFFMVWIHGVIVLICVVIILIILGGCAYLFEILRDNIKAKRRLKRSRDEHYNEVPEPKQPNVLVAWYKQLKDKTCSKIKWVK